jgi:hypothetical protein
MSLYNKNSIVTSVTSIKHVHSKRTIIYVQKNKLSMSVCMPKFVKYLFKFKLYNY